MLYLYRPSSDDDVILASAWSQMKTDGDLEKLWFEPPSLSTFLQHFQNDKTIAVFTQDELGCSACFWFEPFLSGAAFNLWVSKRKRRSPNILQALLQALDTGLEAFQVIFSITWQERLVKSQKRLGFHLLSELPEAYRGKPCWFMVLRKAAFDSAKERFHVIGIS